MPKIYWEEMCDKKYGPCPEDTVKALYVDQQLSMAKVSEKIGVSKKSLERFMKQYKIKRRPSRRELKAKYHKELNKILKENPNASYKELVRKTGCSFATIELYRRKKIIPQKPIK